MPSINKTKSGERFRAPTDQARKMDRKKENKRNKRDRQQIRQAMAKYCNLEETTSKLLVLERQILGLDPQPFHIDVLKKKQRVLQDSINKRRVTLQQGKDENELKKFNEKMHIYQQDCQRLAVLAYQARMAREADPDSIPLPMGEVSTSGAERQSQLLAPSMIKRKVEFQLPPRPPRAGMKPPGPPCGLAPTFSDSEEEDDHGGHDQYDDGDLAPVPIPDFDNPYPPMHRNYAPPASYHQMPPRMPTYHQHPQSFNPMGFQNRPDEGVISSAPQINRNQEPAAPATLSAAPELRNLRRETVKLVPAQLLRRPQDNKAASRPIVPVQRRPEQQKQAKNTDEAYNDFMKELDGLI